MASRPHVNRANKYARDVVAGRIDVCRYVQLACQRHLDDLAASKRKSYPYRFDRDVAQQVCEYAELFDHVKGRWAARNEKFVLEPWQCFILACVFGWLKKADGKRRFRKVYKEVPRKNGKSPLAAIVGHRMFAADGEHGAEVYSGATTEDQAWEVFRPARLMALKNEAFCDWAGVEIGAKNMHIAANGSRFRPVVGKPGDGASPSCAITDEFHEHDSPDQADTFVTGMVGREQPLWWVVTTAGANLDGPCYQMRSDAVDVLEGHVENDAFFAIIYTIDADDDWTTVAALKKANPNYGVSVDPEILKAEQKEAIQSAYKQNAFKTKHLDIWCQAREAWMNMKSWSQCGDATLNERDFYGDRCFAGLDLASKHDMTSFVRVYVRQIDGEDHFYVFGSHYVPEAQAREKHAYAGWAHDGHLHLTDGEELDFARVRDDVISLHGAARIEMLGYDQYLAVQLAQELRSSGITAAAMPMTVKTFSDPMKWVFAHTLSGRIHHDNNQVMNWMVSNVTAKIDANDNLFPRKERPDNKIDGVVALLMAMYLAKNAAPAPKLGFIAA
jgi:phage terminase large subunit-like protein